MNHVAYLTWKLSHIMEQFHNLSGAANPIGWDMDSTLI